MSENQSRGIHDPATYERMTTEELEQILRLDAENTDGQESDAEMILYVMEVLTRRRKQTELTENTALEAYESFKQNYMPQTDDPAPVPAKRKCFRWAQALTAAAAVLVIVVFGSMTAKAFGVDIWNALIQWTQETFHFGSWHGLDGPDEGSDMTYSSFQEALQKGNVPVSMIPSWMPEGYTLADVTVKRNPAQKIYRAKYTKQDLTLKITVQDYLDTDPVHIEQSEGLVEEYTASGVTYYLYDNNGQTQVIWVTGSYECYIAGPLTIEELKMMIDSIGKG